MRPHRSDDKENTDGNNNSDHYYCTLEQLTLVANIISMTNFFNWFAMTRTFVNSFEMALTSIALCYWDWTGGSYVNSRAFSFSLFWALMACFVRVSNGLIWFILGGFLILSILKRREFSKFGTLFKKIIGIFLIVFTINVVLDYYFYGYLIFPIFRFLKFNFTSPLSQFYGTAPWNFYLFQGIPILTGSALIPLLYGMRHSLSSRTTSEIMYAPFVQMKFVVLLNIIIFSTLAHKEFRFIYSLQPLFLVIATFGYHKIRLILSSWSKVLNIVTSLIVGATMLGAVTMSMYHESGVISVVEYLHEIPHIESVGFIMPCHSTPWQSHLHRNDIKDLWSISCEPPIHLLDDPEASYKLKNYMDESDYLYDDMPKFLKAHMVDHKGSQDTDVHEWPQYLVIFQHLDDKLMHDYLKASTYIEEKRFFNSLGHWDSRRAGDVILFHKSSSK
ncbi:glycosylphosphatidylinositol anchor biosynthesis [Maudiozyma exigua]|uniref:Mannosyltransferase n=1 Tax=Maudiozyma exigua TaxID=34358 RepID=A0A9P6W691_MAUEX|nr:glycosylphosphatidylinositol anchor biosynthesis [Kazachstania exigua]